MTQRENEKRGFIVYATLEEQLAFLSDAQVGQLFRAMFVHFRGEEPVLEDLMVRMTYTGVRTIMDLDREKWERVREARRKAGRLGGIASGESRRSQGAERSPGSGEELVPGLEQLREPERRGERTRTGFHSYGSGGY